MLRIADSSDAISLEHGDLVIIPHGASHALYCEPGTEPDALPLEELLEITNFTGSGTLVYGDPGTNHETQLVCGHFAFDPLAKHPLIDSLPAHILIKNYGENVGRWMENTLRVIGAEVGRDELGSDLIALKMSEIIFAQALRTYLNAEGQYRAGLAGFADPKLVRALNAIHQKPSEKWTLETLAEISGMSRTSFATKFFKLMGATPLNYLTQWRMQLAARALIESMLSIVEIAEQSGYQSEAAFSRVFKKHFGSPPATYRRHSKTTKQ